MRRTLLFAVFTLAISLIPHSGLCADKKDAPQTWTFAVSGDSRNCGDVVMPAMAADASKHNVSFYWHLGDLRWITAPDQDFVQRTRPAGETD